MHRFCAARRGPVQRQVDLSYWSLKPLMMESSDGGSQDARDGCISVAWARGPSSRVRSCLDDFAADGGLTPPISDLIPLSAWLVPVVQDTKVNTRDTVTVGVSMKVIG